MREYRRRSSSRDVTLIVPFELIVLFVIIGLTSITALVLSIISVVNINNTPSISTNERTFSLPAGAVRISDDHFRIFRNNGTIVGEILVYRHNKTLETSNNADYETSNIKNVHAPSIPDRLASPLNSQCYGALLPGVRWRSAKNFIIDTSNTAGLSPSFLINSYNSAINTWQTIANQQVWGSMSQGSLNPATFDTYDGVDGLAFAAINIPGASNAVAVTISFHTCLPQDAFGNCLGPDQFVEFKQIYDTVNYRWGDATQDSSVFDMQEIMTHENGHVMGLIDLYLSVCSADTMYGYASVGQTNKRTPTADDIQGICSLGYPCSAGGGSSPASGDAIESQSTSNVILSLTALLLLVMIL